MTDYEAEARRRLDEVRKSQGMNYYIDRDAHSRLLEEMAEKDAKAEAFKREVSDAVEKYNTTWHKRTPSREEYMLSFGRFIITKPVDPIADAWAEATGNTVGMEPILEALAKRGYDIVKKGDTK